MYSMRLEAPGLKSQDLGTLTVEAEYVTTIEVTTINGYEIVGNAEIAEPLIDTPTVTTMIKDIIRRVPIER
jgi:hypothetical protein